MPAQVHLTVRVAIIWGFVYLAAMMRIQSSTARVQAPSMMMAQDSAQIALPVLIVICAVQRPVPLVIIMLGLQVIVVVQLTSTIIWASVKIAHPLYAPLAQYLAAQLVTKLTWEMYLTVVAMEINMTLGLHVPTVLT